MAFSSFYITYMYGYEHTFVQVGNTFPQMRDLVDYYSHIAKNFPLDITLFHSICPHNYLYFCMSRGRPKLHLELDMTLTYNFT